MQPFNNMLAVGMKAMVINTFQECNRHLIGKVVTIEALPDKGDDVSMYFDVPENVVVRANYVSPVAITSGIDAQASSKDSNGNSIKYGFADFKREYLMPLPPLNEKEIETEKQLETVE